MESASDQTATDPAKAGRVGATVIRPGWVLLSILVVLISGIIAILQAPDPQPIRTDKSFLEWLRYPVETNPGLRLPSAPAQINSIAFADDGKDGLAVGGGGAILASADGGETWTAQDSGISNDLNGVFCSGPCKQAWAVGDGGAILNTTDGGNHWVARQIEGRPDLRAVQFGRGDTAGWIVGSSGNIWSSRDGGQSWQKKQNPDLRRLNSLCFDAQGQRGWAVGSGGVILRTVTGGESWSPQNSGSRNFLKSVSCGTDGQDGWAVGYNVFLSTTDGGEHWTKVNPDPSSQVSLYFTWVGFSSDGRRGWASRDDGVIITTADRGKIWTKQNSGTNTELYALHFDREGKRGWGGGGSGTIISTSNEGSDWVTRTTSKFSHLRSIHLNSSGREATAVGDAGVIITTSDGGVRWTSQRSGVDQRLNRVVFLADNRRGWAVGNAGRIIITKDGGEHWTPQESPVALNLNHLQFESSGQRGWAAGNFGLMLTTENGGEQWNATSLPGAGDLVQLHFEPTGKQGWVVGAGGFIAATADGGRTWQQANSGTSNDLMGIWFDADARQGWAVGITGTIIFTDNGGRTWSAQRSGTNASLAAVQFLPGGQRGWVTGSSGIILTTIDGGKNWSAVESKVGSTRAAVAFTANGSAGWAVGYPPMIKTSNGGETWEPIVWPISNERYPAPWFWISLSVAAFCFWRSVRTDPASATSAIDAMGTSDAPVNEFALDRLQFAPLARGISRFLRNTNTRPPLTLTISGDWGSGKSTLMELVCADLRGYGIRPVWFNAWHHQQEEQLLAALLNAIRATGLPSIGSADGLAFRLRLLLSRSKKHFAISVLLIAAIATLTGYLLGHHFSEWIVLWNRVSSIGANMSSNKEAISTLTIADASWLSAQLAGAAATLYSLYKGFAAFPIDPAVLLASTADSFKLRNASAKTGFRDRFATEFGEVTDALPYTMVIVIDDLDRCQPSTVLTIMEAVNFLVSSGTCFVMFGMATNRVEAALAIEFEKIADELAAVDKRSAIDEKQTPDHRRLIYVRDYLDKLVNLEIVVPNRAEILPQLLEDAPTANSAIILKAAKQCLEFWPSWLAAVIVVLGLSIGFGYRSPQATTQTARPPITQIPLEQIPRSTAAPTASPAGSAVLTAATNTPYRYAPKMEKNSQFVLDKLTIAITIAIIVAFAGGIVLYGLRANLRSVHDSQEFRAALRVWISVVQRRRVTPRGIKRFGNRLRYLAMLQQPGRLDETGFDKLRRRLRAVGESLSRRDAPNAEGGLSQPDASTGHGISESVLVALAALYEVYGPEWRSHMRPSAAGGLESAIQTAIAGYELMTKKSWPPGDDDVAAFERLLSGIRNA